MAIFIVFFIILIIGGLIYAGFTLYGSFLLYKLNKKAPASSHTEFLSDQSTDNNNIDENPDEVVQEKKSEIPIDYTMLDPEKVINRYLTTQHYSALAEYNYYQYFRAEIECLIHSLKPVSINLSETKLYRRSPSALPYEKTKNININSKTDTFRNFIVIDTETTGLKTSGNDIIEIAAIKFLGFKPKEIFHTLLKPRKAIPPEATKINHITNEMVAEAPKFSQIHDSLKGFLKGYPLVMHNALFDLKFLFVSGLDLDYDNITVYDTLALSKYCIKDCENKKLDSYRLKDVCEEVCIYFDGAHRATVDAIATGLLFNEIVKIKKQTDELR